jgi:iron complex outermembrane recepter protein
MTYKTMLLRGVCALVAAAVAPTGQALAQGSATLDEVVVTARKREESLQSVPVAVTAQTGQQLERQSIDEPSDLARIVPSMSVPQQTSAKPNIAFITLRGQTAGDNILTVSQPVGLYIDSVNIPHPVGANGSFFDLSRVEVLKGPQGTLYGRNTTAGAMNIITRNADWQGVHGYLAGELTKFKGRKINGAVNLPVVEDVLAVRLAGQYWKRDGYGRSRITGQKQGGDHDDKNIRATVNFNPVEDVSIVVKGELGKANRVGNLVKMFDLQTTGAAATAVQEANANDGSPAGLNLLQSCVGGDIFVSCSGSRQFEVDKTRHFSLDMNWDITDNVRLRSVTGYHWFSVLSWFDIDGSPYQLGESSGGTNTFQPDTGIAVPPATARLPNGAIPPGPPYLLPFKARPDQESGQWTQELNLSGSFIDDRLNWLLGGFVSSDKGNGVQISVRNPSLGVLTAPFYAPTIPNSFEGLDVDAKTWAVFTQNDFKITDIFSVTGGLRYTKEKLFQNNASWAFNQNFPSAVNPSAGPGKVYQCLYGLLGPSGVADSFGPARLATYQTDPKACALPQRAKFDGWSYLASLNAQWTPDILTYAKISKGFRGGALQLRLPQAAPAEPEIAKDIEVGIKGDFLERRLRANFAWYRTNYSNQQFSFLVILPSGARTTQLFNAASARYKGWELEVQARPISGLSISGSMSHLDAKYTSFPNFPSASFGTIDASGFRVENTNGGPTKWTYNLSARYDVQAGPGVLGLQADYSDQSDTPLTRAAEQPAVADSIERFLRHNPALVSARIDYDLKEIGLRVSAFGTNLTNEKYAGNGLAQGTNGGITTGIVREPRVYGVALRYTFGGD